MIRINLLPHRAEKRKRRKVQFAALSGVSIGVGVLLVALGYGAIQARIFYQEKRNAYLQREISKLDKQIAEIKRLRQQVQALLARKEVVEKLQSTRSDVVHLMDQMLRILPQGVYLRQLKQTGNNISVIGIAQSSARVSTLMHAIDESPWLADPHLIEVTGANVGKVRANQFSMTFKLIAGPPPASAPAPAKTAAATSAPSKLAASAPAALGKPAASAPAASSAPASAPAVSPLLQSAPAATKPVKAKSSTRAKAHKKSHRRKSPAKKG